jgi:hypothetical protein
MDERSTGAASRASTPAGLRARTRAFSRRSFLRGVGTTASLAALSRLRAIPAVAEGLVPGDGRFFSEWEREMLTQVVERMVFTGDPRAPAVRETRTLDTLDRLTAGLDPTLSGRLPLALRLVEWGPIFFDLRFSRFTRMSDAEKDASLEVWMSSRLALRRLVFLALRNLALLGYYSQDETWKLIGYKGPLLGTSTAPGESPA